MLHTFLEEAQWLGMAALKYSAISAMLHTFLEEAQWLGMPPFAMRWRRRQRGRTWASCADCRTPSTAPRPVASVGDG